MEFTFVANMTIFFFGKLQIQILNILF